MGEYCWPVVLAPQRRVLSESRSRKTCMEESNISASYAAAVMKRSF